jgi:hypothetical protein
MIGTIKILPIPTGWKAESGHDTLLAATTGELDEFR